MRNPFHTPFFAVFQNEVILNSKRVAPYALTLLFIGHGMLWWFRGPAIKLGWATNSDFYIVRNLLGFSFLLGLPVFNAIIMGDPAIRDFRFGIDPLIFSKPVSRASYLLGKFFGNFFVLVCCQSAFTITQVVMQAFPTSQMVVLPVSVFPYFKHFFFFVVITHLVLAAIYFTVGTLTRNSKIVYVMAACFYPFYTGAMVLLLKGLPLRWRIMLDPFLLRASLPGNGFLHSAEFLNSYVVTYTADMIANRALMILFAGGLLAIVYARFTISERPGTTEKTSMLSLSTAPEAVYYDADSFRETHGERFQSTKSAQQETLRATPLPEVTRAHEGVRPSLNKLIAILSVELRLLLAERSLLVILPLAIFLSVLEVALYDVAADVSYSAAYAMNTAKILLLFLCGITVFFSGEAMHRDREIRIQPVLWSMPAPNSVLLLSKFLTTFLLALILILLVSVTAMAIQLLRGHRPIEISAYLIVYFVILIPTIGFVAAASTALNVVLRDKYLTYAVCIGLIGGLFYLYTLGFNHWLYNPALYQLWTYSDLKLTGSGQNRILIHRVYCLGLSGFCLAAAHLGFRRKGSNGFKMNGRLSSSGWGVMIAAGSVIVAVVTGLMVK